jgi:hypothetical protein
MKQKKDYTLIALLIPFLFALIASGAFSSCNDNEAKLTTFNDAENKAVQFVQARDYQIDIVEDSLLIFDGNRYVGAVVFNWNNPAPIDSLIMADNE